MKCDCKWIISFLQLASLICKWNKIHVNVFINILLFFFEGIGADVLDLTGQNADMFGKLKEENTWFELTDAQKQYMDMVQNVNDYIKNEYHAIHTFLWKSGYSGVDHTMPKR